MLYQNISPENILKKSNSLFNIREKIYKENNMKPDECTNIMIEKCKNVLERKKCPDLIKQKDKEKADALKAKDKEKTDALKLKDKEKEDLIKKHEQNLKDKDKEKENLLFIF